MKRFSIVVLCIVLSLLFVTSASAELIKYGSNGDEVVRIQYRLRDLGYFNFKPTGNFQTMTVNAAIAFQEANNIMADGSIGDESKQTLFGHTVYRAAIPQSLHIPIGHTTDTPPVPYGILKDWSEVNALIPVSSTIKITDLYSGDNYSVKRTGGTNHADVETVSPTDTAAMVEVFGGEFNASKRPVLVEIDGISVAASLQGLPHGSDSVAANEMSGHCCLYFYNSTSDVMNLPDIEHVNQVRKAGGQ
jgi:peptidoglycan hydrolase-like protein with peptidoglycan-binding domain